MDGDRRDLAEFTISNYLTILVLKNSQVVDGYEGDWAKFVKKKRITDHDFPPPLYVGGK